MRDERRRVAAIGLDAAEWTLIDRLMADGSLPNLAAIAERSARARLHNVVAYRSELPWTQFLTGRDARGSRYWSTVRFDPDGYEAVCRGALDVDPFYAAAGVRTIAFDVPHTSLSTTVDGVQVMAWGAHSPQYPRAASPRGLLTEIDERFGPHPAFGNDSDDLGCYDPGYIAALGEAMRVGAVRRIDVARWLQERFPDWELFITVMSESHSGGHHLWHGIDESHPMHGSPTGPIAREACLDIYRTLDAQVGRFAETVPDDAALVVFSLHGMQSNENDLASTVLLPELLHRRQFGRAALRDPDQRAWRAAGCPPVVPPPGYLYPRYMRTLFTAKPSDRLLHLLHRFPVLHETVRKLAGKPVSHRLGELGVPIPPETTLTAEEISALVESIDYQVATWYQPFWSQMPAFVLPTFSDAHVRINLAGRERNGRVARDDYRRACDDVIRIVEQCRDGRTGQPVLADAQLMRADDPWDPEAPDADIVLLWTGPIDSFDHPEVGLVGPFPFSRTGEHSSNGFALISGGGVAPGDLGDHPAFAITPTILELLGAPLPGGLAGTSMLATAGR